MDEGANAATRRALLRAVGAGASVTAVGTASGDQTGVTGADGTSSEPHYGEWFDATENYEGETVEMTGTDPVTVRVGATGNGGNFAFDPPAVHVSLGATVRWEWTGEGEVHSVRSKGDGPLDSGDVFADAGVHYEYTFDEEGIFEYYCAPHEALGMKGAIVVGDGYRTTTFTPAGGTESVTPEVTWRFETGGDVLASPTVVDGTVYVCSHDENLYALDAASGSERWRYDLGFAHRAVMLVDGLVLAANADGVLHALDAEDGEQRWRFETGEFVNSPPSLTDGAVVVDAGSVLYAVDPETGTERWRFDADEPITSNPAADDETVFFGTENGTLYAIGASEGERQWRFEAVDRIDPAPTVADGTVYVGSDQGRVYAVDAASGEAQWEYDTVTDVHSGPTAADGTVFVGSGGGFLHAIDADAGVHRWRFETEGQLAAAPTVAGGTVFVGGLDGGVYAVDRDAGAKRWRFETNGEVISSPTVVDGVCYVGSKDGFVYALETGVEGSSEGSRTWLGTLGHHGDWRATAADASAAGSGGQTVGTGPGMALGSAVLGLTGAGYLLGRRATSEGTDGS